jgi:NAD+ diphosphatase
MAFVSTAGEVPDDAGARCYVFRGSELLVVLDGGSPRPPLAGELAAAGVERELAMLLGTLDGVACLAVAVADDAPTPAGWEAGGLRAYWDRLSDEDFALAGRAFQIVDWDRTHRFCGRCATPNEGIPGERGKHCPACGLTAYPRLTPAVIVRVSRGDELLLAQGVRFPGAFYSVLAGFVEPGESLEDTVHREILEEVGIQVRDLRYFGSQPWPFPHSLMLGFTAEYAGGELRPDPTELLDADWFRWDALPELPGRVSIARRLIDAFVEERRARSIPSPST